MKEFNALVKSLRQSLKHCQQENLNRPFDKAAQYAFAADNYSTLTEFNEWFWMKDPNWLKVYIEKLYYPIAYFGVLFARLEQDYDSQVSGNGRSRLSPESSVIVNAYRVAIEHAVDGIREWAAEYATTNVVPFRELTMNNFTVDGKYITNPPPAGHQFDDLQQTTTKKSLESTKLVVPSQPSLALFYYYCHEKGCLPPFQSGRLVKEYKQAVEPYKLSWKSFQQHYNRFTDKKQRMAAGNLTALREAIKMLAEYPLALDMAQDELTTIETRKPLT